MSGAWPGAVPGFRELEVGGAPIRDARLRRGGWTRRFVGAPPRLEEARALYERLGWEVRLEPPGPEDLPAGCGECPAASALFRVVYTRSRDRTRTSEEAERQTRKETKKRDRARRTR